MIETGEYWLQITRVGNGRVRLDCIDLYATETPAEAVTWGKIKALFAD